MRSCSCFHTEENWISPFLRRLQKAWGQTQWGVLIFLKMDVHIHIDDKAAVVLAPDGLSGYQKVKLEDKGQDTATAESHQGLTTFHEYYFARRSHGEGFKELFSLSLQSLSNNIFRTILMKFLAILRPPRSTSTMLSNLTLQRQGAITLHLS